MNTITKKSGQAIVKSNKVSLTLSIGELELLGLCTRWTLADAMAPSMIKSLESLVDKLEKAEDCYHKGRATL